MKRVVGDIAIQMKIRKECLRNTTNEYRRNRERK